MGLGDMLQKLKVSNPEGIDRFVLCRVPLKGGECRTEPNLGQEPYWGQHGGEDRILKNQCLRSTTPRFREEGKIGH